jgi:hypothetical protein
MSFISSMLEEAERKEKTNGQQLMILMKWVAKETINDEGKLALHQEV